jgi:hypothetical protein
METRTQRRSIVKYSTDCCALCQLSITDSNTKEEIKRVIARLKREARSKNYLYTGKQRGQKAVFVITTPTERNLVKNLQEIGFKSTFEFERREGYPSGNLIMWCYNL